MANGRELVPLRTGFDVVLRGYRRGSVRQYVQSVEEELRSLAADRDANAGLAEALAGEVEQLRASNELLRRRLDAVCRTPIEQSALQDRLHRMLELATEEAAEITARAQAAAENCWATAEEAAGRLRARYETSIRELDGRRREMEAEHRTLLRQTRLEVTVMTTEADRRCRALDAAAARRRARVETDFEVAMSARRTSAMREIAEQSVAARGEAVRLVAEATAEADRLVGSARAEAEWRLREAAEEADRRVEEASATAGGLVGDATAEAERCRREASEESSRLVAEADRLVGSARAEAEWRLREAAEEADRRVRVASEESARLVGDAASKAERCRRETATESRRLVGDAIAEADRLAGSARAEADWRVREATEEAARRVGVARQEVGRLRELHGRIAGQVRGAREVLAGVGALVEPGAEDGDGPSRPATDIPRQRARVDTSQAPL